MTRHFSRLRKLTLFANVAVPILLFMLFVLYANGHILLLIVTFIPTFFLASAFPNVKQQESDRTVRIGILDGAAYVMLIIWLTTGMEEFLALLSKIFDRQSLQDWRIVLAMLFYHTSWVFSNYRGAKRFSDEDFISFYSASR